MSLQSNQMLSNYRLVEKIGEGGMGVVWKAVDTTLGREVAIKVLPDLFAGEPDRLARFEREAKLLASLNHPSIATIHGLHESSGVRFLAMELAQGTNLARRLQDGPLPLDEALAIALQVTAALEAAHDTGIVHRDLKPGNIQVAPDGTVKVLDFGLAKAFEADPSSPHASLSPTLTTPATRAGVVLGTAAYMSPEQAKGKIVDRRADIWAFGCVLYEMLTGVRPFTGDGASEMLAAVIMSTVDLKKLPGSVPPSIRKLLRRCLEKDPRRRLRDIGEARIVLEETIAGTVEEPGSATAGPGVAPRRRAGIPAIAAGLILSGLAGAALMRALAPRPDPGPLRRFEMPATGPFRSGIQGNLLAISPDGSKIACVESGRLRIRPLDRLDSREVITAGEAAFLFWSPDSAWLGYGAAGKIWKVPADGGQGTVIADRPGEMTGGSGASWGPDGRIVLGRGEPGLWEIPARGGEVRKILDTDPNVEGDLHQPCYLPDGSGVIFVSHAVNGRPDRLCLLAGGTRKDLLHLPGEDIWFPTYSATGHILYRRQPANSGIWALPFSLKSHEVIGEPFPVIPEGDVPSVSNDGTLVYARGTSTRQTQLVWVDRSGKVLARIGQPQEVWPFPVLSPDERQVAIAVAEQETREVWIHDIARGTRSRLTFGAQASYAVPFWYPSGDRLLYDDGSNFPFTTRSKSADGSGEAQELANGWASSLSPDGRYLAYTALDPNNGTDLWLRDLTSRSEPVPLVRGTGGQMWSRVSPDGRYVAYLSDETGPYEIYLKRFPGGEGKWQVSASGGFWPRWSRRGNRIYYVNGDRLMEVNVSTVGAAPQLGNPQEVFTRPSLGWALIFNWPAGFDVSSDGQRFLINVPVGQGPENDSYFLVQNWMAEFGQSR
ncbi:MAG TPA: protein kinase [Candidatus Polarisedimenticolia bacterium]|jgi:Tol biopolymer transport system component